MNSMTTLESGLVFDIGNALLLVLIFTAMVFDIRSHRIPNFLVLAGLCVGLALHTFSTGGSGIGYALTGLAVGFGLFIPLYMFRAMGAGDVKLMAMVGAFLGPASTLGAVLTTLLAGGLLAIAVALWKGVLSTMVTNIRFMMTHASVSAMSGVGMGIEPLSTTAAKLPYAVAIAAGTLVHVMLVRSGHALVG